MGKSVIAFKVIVTPRFHFECFFIGIKEQSRDTNNDVFISRMADIKICPPCS